MTRGRLRVLLGAAPGVGKTVAMLEEGHRAAAAGRQVVIGLLETHGRSATAAAATGLPVVPRRVIRHRGIELTELDVDAVLARRPEVVLVDELAHTNAPGSRHDKRWQDVDDLLDAGLDVLTTVNVQHIASLGDVVQQITGVTQRETVPDEVLRRAERIEVIDLAPQSLRDRLAAGQIYPADRIDASLSHYFRLGNLTALRELALLWLADEVDSALLAYRSSHGIDHTWQTRERVVVALTGGPEGETLIKRAARIAARSGGGELMAVHVTGQHGLRTAGPELLTRQRALVEQLGGTYHQVVGDDIPTTLVDFARGAHATQLVLGASRRSRWATAFTGPGIGATVTREAGTIDVHLVGHAEVGAGRSLPRAGGALSPRRQGAGVLVALLVGPMLTWLLATFRSYDGLTGDVLSFQLLVVVVALVGGIWPALFAAVMSGLTMDFLFVEPLYTLKVSQPSHLVTLGLYVVIAILVSVVVDRAARQTRAARRAAAESELLATVAGSVLRGEDAVQALVSRTREAFGLSRVRLVRDGVDVAVAGALSGGSDLAAGVPSSLPDSADSGDGAESSAVAGAASAGSGEVVVTLADGAELRLSADLVAAERRVLAVIVAQLEAALEHRELSETAAEVEPLAAADRVRSALLSALSHDLRRPLAAATAAVGGLRLPTLDDHDRAELLSTADESLAALAALLTDLLDVSRVQAGVLAVSAVPLDPADVVGPAVEELGVGPHEVDLVLPDGVLAQADPVLLQRVLVNLLANALRHRPAGTRVRVAVSTFADTVEIRVADRGPGIPDDRHDDIFRPFQRLGDVDNTTGLGLGLALSRGFVEGMGGSLLPETTPGGGLTMVVRLPLIGDGVQRSVAR